MHRFVTFITALALFVTADTVLVAAQDGTPAAGVELAPGVTAEVFAGAPSEPALYYTVYLARFTFQPGSEIFPHSHPGTTLLSVESGTFGWTLVKGRASVLRGAASGATGPPEILDEPGTEVLLEVGDAIYYEDNVIHTARGAGTEPAVIRGALLLRTGEPLLIPAGEMAGMESTPAP
jgi:hypothetical protein